MLNQFEAEIRWISPESLIAYVNNVKQHPTNQVNKIASSIAEFGFTVPIVIDRNNIIIAGHGRLAAAQKLGLSSVPVIVRDDLSPTQVKALRIADNRVAESPWDIEALQVEIESLRDVEFNLDLVGFDLDELDSIFNLGVLDFQGKQIFGEDGNPGATSNRTHDDGTRSHALDDVEQTNQTNQNQASDEPKSDGSLLALLNVAIAEPEHQVNKGEVWRLGDRHVLIIAEVLTEWQQWRDYLKDDVIFAPYPGPFVPLTIKAEGRSLVMVQPDSYIAGHILDQYALAKGADSVEKI
jgi:hypothetical protein